MTAQPTLRSLNRPCVSSPPPPPGSHPDLSCTLRPASDRSLASYSPRVHIHIYIYMILYHIFTIYGVRIHHLCRLLMHFAAGLIIILREFYPQIVTRSVTYCPVLLCIKKTDEGSRACRGIWSTCVGSRPVADDDGVFKKPSCPVGPAPRGVLRHRHPSTPARRAPRGGAFAARRWLGPGAPTLATSGPEEPPPSPTARFFSPAHVGGGTAPEHGSPCTIRVWRRLGTWESESAERAAQSAATRCVDRGVERRDFRHRSSCCRQLAMTGSSTCR